MDIRNFFSGLFPQKPREQREPRDVLRTPHGDFFLAKGEGRERMRKVAIELQRATDALTRKDIMDWRDAWQMAINVDNPNRQRLYDIYRDVEADLHLSGCVGQRTGFVMARSFKIVDGKGDNDGEALRYFDRPWFKQLLRYALEANFWGHSLIELGEPAAGGDGRLCYSDVTLLPRKHVIPEYGRVITDLGQDWTTGIPYREAPFSDWLREAGRPDSLGLYLKAATQTIPKKNMLAFWDTFGEIFGMPMRIARTTSRDRKEIDRLDRMLREAGASLSMVAGQDTEIEFVESGKGDAYNVYDKRVERANSELSKLVIGQTMTIEDGSSLSQSKTHLEVFQNLVESDCDMLRDIVNNQLIPRMARHGFPVKGLRFEWDYAVDYTPEQQKAYEEMVLRHYRVDPRYFEDKYGMPCGEGPHPDMPAAGDGGPDGKKPGNRGQRQNTRGRFFRPGPSGHEGPHRQYAARPGTARRPLPLSKERGEGIRRELSRLFDGMMRELHSLKGPEFRVGALAGPKAREFVEAHAAVLDSGFQEVGMSGAMRRRLTRSDYVFSGMKTFHELREAFPSLLDENGKRKPFERFLNDVRKIDETYNSSYLRAEYNFVQASAEMAAKWERFMEDGGRYNLQYRTANDGKVRPEHAALHGVTLPVDDPFWEEYYPPNGWNCRCTVVQVRKSKYPETPHDEAMARGGEALRNDPKGIFRFNAGKERKTFPPGHPYYDAPDEVKRIVEGLADGRDNKGKGDDIRKGNAKKKTQRVVKTPLPENVKARRKEIQRIAYRTLCTQQISVPELPMPIKISKRAVKEWLNQPFADMEAKNEALLRVPQLLQNAVYRGCGVDKHDPAMNAHLFQIAIGNVECWIIVREFYKQVYKLHSLTDSSGILKILKKK